MLKKAFVKMWPMPCLKMRKYIIFKEQETDGPRFYILQRNHPHFVGAIVDNPYYKSILKVPVPQTMFYIAYHSLLRGNLFPVYQGVDAEMKDTFVDMAMWYYKEVIEPNPKKYKKWLLKVEPTT